jgi:hypothetical protein
MILRNPQFPAENDTHVEAAELTPIGVERRVVEVDELLCNGVDVAHAECYLDKSKAV